MNKVRRERVAVVAVYLVILLMWIITVYSIINQHQADRLYKQEGRTGTQPVARNEK